MVENVEFLNRLRNGHLEKSAVTGVRRPSRSPKTAKTPLKVHLRLRFQNLGKPRTAGLCGRAARISDCGPLSCAKIERPSPLEKPSCKVRLFVQNRSRKYRPKVTVTTLFQTAFHPDFQPLSQTAHVRSHSRKRVHTRLSEKDRTQRLTRRNRGLPFCDHSAALCCQRNPFYSTVLLYTYISRFSVNPHHQAEGENQAKLPSLTLSPTVSHPDFQLLAQTAHVRFHRRKRVHTRLSEKDRTQRLTRRNSGCFGWGWYHCPRSVSHVSETLRGQVSERRTLPLWDLGRGCSQRTQKAFGTAMRLCASLFRGVAAPLGCVICLQFGDVAVFSLCVQYFLNVRDMGGTTTLGALCVLPKLPAPACQKGLICRFLRSGEQRSLRSAYFFRIYRYPCR